VSSKKLYTLGYEGMQLESLIQRLMDHDINVLVDVRESPQSRKPGFSQRVLSQKVQEKGVQYLHIPELGSPSEARRELRRTGDIVRFNATYLSHVGTQKDAVQTLIRFVDSKTCCLLCYEKRPDACHRRVLAHEIGRSENSELEVIHL